MKDIKDFTDVLIEDYCDEEDEEVEVNEESEDNENTDED